MLNVYTVLIHLCSVAGAFCSPSFLFEGASWYQRLGMERGAGGPNEGQRR